MLDLNTPLGRDVASAADVLSVIRPQLRFAQSIAEGTQRAMIDGLFDYDPDFNLTDGGDQSAETAVFTALVDDGLGSVTQWARDMALVFDKEKTREFIRQSLIAASAKMLPAGALEY